MITEIKLYADGEKISEMKTIKIIDLLNKIANGEDVPKVIKYTNTSYEFDKKLNDYTCSGYRLFGNELEESYKLIEHLNDEVEILDEPKEDKIEKLDQTLNRFDIGDDYYRYIMENRFKINELIDEVNKLI